MQWVKVIAGVTSGVLFLLAEPVAGQAARAQATAGGPSPGKLAAKDLVFVLHPRTMAIAVVTFGGKP
jgi:hypothetical protein